MTTEIGGLQIAGKGCRLVATRGASCLPYTLTLTFGVLRQLHCVVIRCPAFPPRPSLCHYGPSRDATLLRVVCQLSRLLLWFCLTRRVVVCAITHTACFSSSDFRFRLFIPKRRMAALLGISSNEDMRITLRRRTRDYGSRQLTQISWQL